MYQFTPQFSHLSHAALSSIEQPVMAGSFQLTRRAGQNSVAVLPSEMTVDHFTGVAVSILVAGQDLARTWDYLISLIDRCRIAARVKIAPDAGPSITLIDDETKTPENWSRIIHEIERTLKGNNIHRGVVFPNQHSIRGGIYTATYRYADANRNPIKPDDRLNWFPHEKFAGLVISEKEFAEDVAHDRPSSLKAMPDAATIAWIASRPSVVVTSPSGYLRQIDCVGVTTHLIQGLRTRLNACGINTQYVLMAHNGQPTLEIRDSDFGLLTKGIKAVPRQVVDLNSVLASIDWGIESAREGGKVVSGDVSKLDGSTKSALLDELKRAGFEPRMELNQFTNCSYVQMPIEKRDRFKAYLAAAQAAVPTTDLSAILHVPSGRQDARPYR